MAKDCLDTFVRLCKYLQDPCHVATFQNKCGVTGTFPDTLKKADGHLSPRCESGAAKDVGDQEYPRQRHSSNVAVNGEVRSESCGDATATQTDQENTGSPDDAATARAKPLRRNSLTGEAGQEFIIHNKFIFYLFTFGTELGNEMFFIIFFPFLYWNVDALVSRRLIVVWAWNLFVGQSTKDVVRWSRPASPPVVKVEVFYNSEYSMPSTHAMTGTALPFCLFFLTYGRWQYSFLLGLCMALSWSALVCVSRVYMGMHSILEVITGFLYSLLVLAFFQQVLDKIDNFYMVSSYAPFAIVFLHVSLGLVAFSLDSWSTSRGDTAQALGTAVGAALATHVNHQLGLLADPALSALPLSLPPLSAALLLRSLMRFLVGVAVILITRTGMKAVTIPLLCRVHGLPSDDVRKARQQMRVELPYRYIVYSVVGFSCVCIVPIFFSVLNLA